MVWIGAEFPYPCRLSAEAVLANAPDAELEIHVLGKSPTGHAFQGLFSRQHGDADRVSLHEVNAERLLGPVLTRVFRRIPPHARSAQSNLLRLALLHQRGGIYLDFDTFLLRPLHDAAPGAFIGRERVWRHDRRRVEQGLRPTMLPGAAGWGATWALKRLDTQVLRGAGQLSGRLGRVDGRFHGTQANNAVIGAPAGSEFTGRLLEDCRWVDPTVRYSLGPTLVEDIATAAPSAVTVLPTEVLYPVPPSESHRFFDDRRLVLPDATAVVHYVSSNHRRVVASVVPGDRRFGRPEIFWRLAGAMDVRCSMPALHLESL